MKTTPQVTEIDADEFEAASRDPRVIAFVRLAKEYADELIARGHCPQCLVVNCEHLSSTATEEGQS